MLLENVPGQKDSDLLHTNFVISLCHYINNQFQRQRILVGIVPKLCVGSTEDHCVFKVTLCTMKRSFLHWTPLWFTTSFLWWQSYQNMCQVVEQEWWCPVQVEKLHCSEKALVFCFFYNTEKKPNHVLWFCSQHGSNHTALSTRILTSHSCSKQVLHCYSWHSVDGNAANVFTQPLTSQRGGHCLLHTEITLPYQLAVEMKCLMFVWCRKVVAVNQACSESCSNLFFTNLSFWTH